MFESGNLVKVPGRDYFAEVDAAIEGPTGWRLFLKRDDGNVEPVNISYADAPNVVILTNDGGAVPNVILAGLWAEWMQAATQEAKATVFGTSPLRPYAHQMNAVYGAMLPQPRLRFLLADEPGTGKTVMAGLYLREMQRLGFIRRALVVAPAHLVTKWQADFERFFGGGLKRITMATVQQDGLRLPHDLWIVSLELAAVNRSVQEAIRPDKAGWDAVVFDEAHRLTPTAQSLYQVGMLLAAKTPRALLMTATPHRGKEWLFRALMHLVDPEVYPEVGPNDSVGRRTKPGRVHFLRRMKEDLLDYDGITRLFKGRRATNVVVPLGSQEADYYHAALKMVDDYFPTTSATLARMVYGKRAASSLYALMQTLIRRRDNMGAALPAQAAMDADPDDEDTTVQDEARVIHEQSKAAKAERAELQDLIHRISRTLASDTYTSSKWPRLCGDCLSKNGILPGNGEQAVIFTEYADTADWLVNRFRLAGYSAERYSGRDPHHDRDIIRSRFARRDFQVLVSTDAGNEGIDLQTAHVLVNWDIPWSLVRLEQRMGRIHRVGQTRDVELFNLVATDTREGDVLQTLLDNFVVAANRLDGKVFDSLSLVAEIVGVNIEKLLSDTYENDPTRAQAALDAARAVTAAQVETAANKAAKDEEILASTVDLASEVAALQKETLERVNPSIVEAFLRRLAATGSYEVAGHAAGDGLFRLRRLDRKSLPEEFGGTREAIVASSASALGYASSSGADVTQAVSLGPSDAPFRALVGDALREFRPSLFRGGVLTDHTTATEYELFVYECSVSESGGRRRTAWSFLVRVDDTSERLVRWELLANLEAGSMTPETLHPSICLRADEAAAKIREREQDRRAKALSEWFADAQSELERLPAALVNDISDIDQRKAMRQQLTYAVDLRLAELRTMTEVEMGEPHRVGWVRVRAGGMPIDATEADSEKIAMHLVTQELKNEGWAVADVHLEGRGYDLHATKGRYQRCVEVKGVWESAASRGISLTGNEILIARQLGADFWLYVADNCSDGKGTLFGVYPNPTATFDGLMKDVTVFKVPGSALSAKRDEVVS